jgi:hypothetical protein
MQINSISFYLCE